MISQDSLPIILVSAVDRNTAENFINDVVGESAWRPLAAGGGVWSLQNKYYAADVRLLPRGDGEPLGCERALLGGHVVYLTQHECADAAAWSRRAAAVAAGGEVEVCVCACAGEPPASPAPLLHYEPVCLQGQGDGEGGVARVRDALHAHTWRGLRRRGAGEGEWGEGEGAGEAEWGGWQAGGGDEARWAGMVEAAAAAARLSPTSRRRRADALLPALTAALQAALDDD